MEKIKRICVLYGGNSSERDVSIESGRYIYESILKKGYSAELIDYKNVNDHIFFKKYDFIFIALHGFEGESGNLQNSLSKLGINYSGSNSLACKRTWDKVRCKEILIENKILTPEYIEASLFDMEKFDFDKLNFKHSFLKPKMEGSSFNIFEIKNEHDFKKYIKKIRNKVEEFYFEKAIKHREFTVSILNGDCLEPIEIITKSDFYDFNAKYVSENTQLNLVNLAEKKINELKKIAKKSYQALECSGWARVDFVQDTNEKFFVLEINTVPGMTSHSLFPKSAMYSGINYDDLVEIIIESSNE